MFSNPLKKNKLKVAVELGLADGSRVVGYMFVLPNQRLSDALNDERRFVPVEDVDGQFHLLNKTCVHHVLEIASHPPATSNPYALLGLEETASLEEITAAWRAAAKECHPDRWAAAGLPEEACKALTERMMRVNHAYYRLTRSSTAHGI